jgi:hypothetical protein
MKRLLAFAFVIIFSTSPAAAAICYTVTDLGTLPGHDVSHPYIAAAEPEENGLAAGLSSRVWNSHGRQQKRVNLFEAFL